MGRRLRPKGKRKKRQKGLGPQRRQYPARKPVLSVTIQGLPQLRDGLNVSLREAADALRMLALTGIRAGEAGRNFRDAMARIAPVASAAGVTMEETRAILDELEDDYAVHRERDTTLIDIQVDNLYESIVQDVRVIRFKSKKWRVYADTKKAKNRNIPTTNTGTN